VRLASVSHEGRCKFGALVPHGFVDFTSAFAGRCEDLREWLAEDYIGEAQVLVERESVIPLTQITFRKPIPNNDARVFAVGWSYLDHLTETNAAPPVKPFLFSRFPSSLVAHDQDLIKPQNSDRFDYEGEIVIVIGKGGCHITVEKAYEHVAGFSIGMDGSVRDWQQHSVTAGKNFDASGSFGPCIVSASAIPDPCNMELVTRVNGQEMQRAKFADMAWGVQGLVAYVSTICRLEVGDAIFTGTPAGVGSRRTPPTFLRAGDLISVEVSGLGVLNNRVSDEA
jgi:2-keto-4-pentenoate hydratase/2-oxohepta-3-ene-1,7-dioic acid hydratase in catechol pathway